MPPLNVLWVIDHVCYDGSLHGGGRLYWNLLARFDNSQVRVVPCLLRATDTIRHVFEDSPVRVRILDKKKFDPLTLWSFLKLIKTEQIDVMHLHCYGASTFGRLAGLLTGVPAIIHDYDTEVYFPYPWYLGLADRLLAPATRHAIAASPMVRRFLIRKRKIDPQRISTMFHAIPPEKFAAAAPDAAAAVRRQLSLPPDSQLVLTATKLGPQRGNDLLIQVAAAVRRRCPRAVFLVVYKPTRFHRLPNKRYVPVSQAEQESRVGRIQSLIDSAGARDFVRLLPWPDDIDRWMAGCDMQVVPFLSERFSSVAMLEGMAMGKPAVATDLGEQHEIVQHGVDGLLVQPGEPEPMAQAIVQLLDSPAQLEQMGRAARNKAQQLSADACARRLEELYRRSAVRAPAATVESLT